MAGPLKERRRGPNERHTLSVQLMGDRLLAVCACGAVAGGNREGDPRRLSLHDLLRLTVQHHRDLDNPARAV